ncbi:MAG: polyisoprenoid-binding protein YceI [Gammaproteobacteria bacterium]|jgi:polyisoprenoid-binding protein YceI
MRGARLLTPLGFALGLALLSAHALAANYTIDTKSAHAGVNFKFKPLGHSFLSGTCNIFNGHSPGTKQRRQHPR